MQGRVVKLISIERLDISVMGIEPDQALGRGYQERERKSGFASLIVDAVQQFRHKSLTAILCVSGQAAQIQSADLAFRPSEFVRNAEQHRHYLIAHLFIFRPPGIVILVEPQSYIFVRIVKGVLPQSCQLAF